MTPSVLYIDQSSYYGGGQKITFSVLKYLRNNGWNVVVMFPEGGNLQSIALNEKFTYVALPNLMIENGKKKLKDYYLYLKNEKKITFIVKEIIKQYDCSIIYTLSPRLLRIIYNSSKVKNTPIVFHFHMLYNNVLWEYYFRLFLNKFNVKKIIVLSEYCRKWLEHKVIKSDKVVVVNNWVVESHNTLIASTKYELPSIIANSFKYAVIGRILPIKGQKTFIEAALHQCELEKQTEYYIIGDTTFGNEKYKNDLQEFVKQSRFSSRIHFIPFLDEISSAYKCVDCIVVPSMWNEPFGLVAIEAMFFEKSLIVSNRGELPNIVGNGRYASISNAGDAIDLEQKMNNVLSNKLINVNQIHEAKIWVNYQYNSSDKLDMIIKEFNKLLVDR